jgi:biopolymer transport protein ExbB/TolQ
VIVVKAKINGRAFIERIIQLVRSGKAEDAIKLCAQSKAALPDMGLLILRSRSRDEADLQNVADAAALAVIPRLTRRLQYLPMLANVATLLGLLGTIFGLREAFESVSAVSAGERSQQLAAGIAIALNATGFGLLIAVPLSVAHAYLVSQAETIIEQVDEFSVRLINALIDRPDVRLGHR